MRAAHQPLILVYCFSLLASPQPALAAERHRSKATALTTLNFIDFTVSNTTITVYVVPNYLYNIELHSVNCTHAQVATGVKRLMQSRMV